MQSAREELWPPLAAIHESNDSINSDDFSLSMEIGLDGDEHVLLHGLKRNLKSTKELIERYNESSLELYEEITQPEPEEIDENIEEILPDKGQKKLDMF